VGEKALIIGSGLIGVTSAYVLARRGFEVTVLERRDGAGEETSFANGALLTPSMPEPWNTPGSWRLLLKSLVRSDTPLKVRPSALPSLAGWGTAFLRNSSPGRYERNSFHNLTLALHSIARMEDLRRETGIEYGRAAPGTLRVFRDSAAFERAVSWAERLRCGGLEFHRLTAAETVRLEPALDPIRARLSGGIHYPVDEVGDAYKFCVAMAGHCARAGVELRFRTMVSRLETRGNRVTGVICGGERLTADRYVIAAGSYTPSLLAPLGIRVPVRPAKGYSITVDRPAMEPPLRIPLADDDFHAVVVPLEGVIRVAGTAEFTGFDLSLPQARIRNLLTLLRQVLPQVRLEPGAVKPWCGLRPMSPDGVPIIGRTPLENLWINTGHGHLGWTMAAGSAQLLAELMSGGAPGIEPQPYALARFGAAGKAGAGAVAA
jgi:D-amino-acid dehydrogenase